jgi:hypothetical protein
MVSYVFAPRISEQPAASGAHVNRTIVAAVSASMFHLRCWSDVAGDVTAIPHFGFK